MPIYEYQCKCGVRFDEFASFADREKDKRCPSCSKPAGRLMPTTVQGVFRKEVTGPVPQNTGIHSLDTHWDRVVGQASKQNWATHEKRIQDKREVLRNNPEATGHDLSENPDGSWKVLSGKERGFQDRALAINNRAMKSLSQRKTKRPDGRA